MREKRKEGRNNDWKKERKERRKASKNQVLVTAFTPYMWEYFGQLFSIFNLI